ncbi:MAG: radical SAM protein [Nitrospirae bacterium]|nr:radical SAM protein [Nitrospirota bacterium]
MPVERKKERPCHYHELFVQCDGLMRPCCRMESVARVIGHVNDPDLSGKINSFDAQCECESFILRRGLSADRKSYFFLNVETALSCNSKCAMCCVNAPSWRGKYDLYESLTKVIDTYRPMAMLLQGGEVLIQQKTLDWCVHIRKLFPDLEINIATNGNAGIDMAAFLDGIADRIIISIYGFQPETYKKVTGLNLDRTVSFAEELVKRGKSRVNLKYLTTPINFHEAALFLHWALQLLPERIILADSNIAQYINTDTPDNFWDKIIQRTSVSIQEELLSAISILKESGCSIVIDTNNRKYFGISEDFLLSDDCLNSHITTPVKSRATLFSRGTGLM